MDENERGARTHAVLLRRPEDVVVDEEVVAEESQLWEASLSGLRSDEF